MLTPEFPLLRSASPYSPTVSMQVLTWVRPSAGWRGALQDPGYASPGNFGVGGGLDGVPDVFYVQTVNPTTIRPQQYNGRVDFQATSKDLITFTSYYVPSDTTNYNGPVRAANLWTSSRLNESAALVWNRTLSASLLNEARFNVTRWNFNEIASNPAGALGPAHRLRWTNLVRLTSRISILGAPGPGIFAQTTYNFRDTATLRYWESLHAGLVLTCIGNRMPTTTQAAPGRSTTFETSGASATMRHIRKSGTSTLRPASLRQPPSTFAPPSMRASFRTITESCRI